MRCLLVATALLLAGAAEAREPLARPMERTPSIMVGGEEGQTTRTERRRAVRPRSSRRQEVRRTPVTPRASAVYEAETRSINGAIGAQSRQLQREQNFQVDNNLFRQDILRSSPSIGCAPGALGC